MMDVLPLHEVLGKVLSGSGECAKVTWRFLGFSMPFWVLLNLLGLAARRRARQLPQALSPRSRASSRPQRERLAPKGG